MNVTFSCPACDRATRLPLAADTRQLACAYCDKQITVTPGRLDEEKLHGCVTCSCEEMYVRKDFSQRLGVTIIAIGLALSCIPWYYHKWMLTFAFLFGTALFDAMLYRMTGNLLQCYRCHSEYRGMPGLETHSPFDLEIHERHRQSVARLKQESGNEL